MWEISILPICKVIFPLACAAFAFVTMQGYKLQSKSINELYERTLYLQRQLYQLRTTQEELIKQIKSLKQGPSIKTKKT